MRKIAYFASLVLIGAIPGLFLPLENSALGSANRIIGALAIFLWVISLITSRTIRRLSPFHLLAAAFAIWYAISLWWSVDPEETLFRLTLLQAVAMVIMLWDIYRTKPQLEAALQAFVLGGWVSVFTTALAFVRGASSRQWEARFSGGGFDPNDLALLLAMGIPLSIYLAVYRTARHPVLTLLNYAYPLGAILVIIMTGSRGGMIASVPAFLFLLMSVRHMPRNWRVGFALLMVVGACGLTRINLSKPLERLATAGSSAKSDNLSGRGNLWKGGWIAYTHHPYLGVGGGAFPTAAFRYSGFNEKLIAHDTYLSILVELGPVGAIIFSGLILIVLRSILRQPDPLRRVWLTTLLIWMIGVSALSWEFRSQTWLFFILMVISGHLEPAPDNPAPGETTPREAVNKGGSYYPALLVRLTEGNGRAD